MDTSASSIASVVADLRSGRIVSSDPAQVLRPSSKIMISGEPEPIDISLSTAGPTVDATAIYNSLVASDRPVYVYEDHPCISPPWLQAVICYRNEHGNVIAMTLSAKDSLGKHSTWETAESVDWARVRWCASVLLWIGGQSATLGLVPTCGPVHMWRLAIYEDGRPADLYWAQLLNAYPMEHWDMAHLTLLGTLNFMNCRNVQLVEPTRPRAEARRIQRTGVRVSTINVFPVGRSVKSPGNSNGQGVPLSSVRGHFSKYGPEYDRGLLFGKYSGRFWIPQHARGSAEYGESVNDYKLRTDRAI